MFYVAPKGPACLKFQNLGGNPSEIGLSQVQPDLDPTNTPRPQTPNQVGSSRWKAHTMLLTVQGLDIRGLADTPCESYLRTAHPPENVFGIGPKSLFFIFSTTISYLMPQPESLRLKQVCDGVARVLGPFLLHRYKHHYLIPREKGGRDPDYE